MGSSSAGSPNYGSHSQLNDDDDEDRKPNVQYLDSLNAYRKRSRSTEDVGAGTKAKLAKTESELSINSNGYLGVNGHSGGNGIVNGTNGYGEPPPPTQDTVMASQQASEDAVDDVFCFGAPESPNCIFVDLLILLSTVAGMAKPFSQITDEDHEMMTPEEYTAYFDVFQARSES